MKKDEDKEMLEVNLDPSLDLDNGKERNSLKRVKFKNLVLGVLHKRRCSECYFWNLKSSVNSAQCS